MAFPAILIVQNVSIFVFPFLIVAAWKLIGFPFRYRSFSQLLVLAFGLAAIISVLNIPVQLRDSHLSNALEVLPNYVYWTVLVWFMVSVSPYLEIGQLSKAVFWGLMITVFYFFVLQKIGLTTIPIFKGLTQNTFAFILICFSPIAVFYSKFRYGFWIGIVFSLFFVLCGFLSASRSSSVLVLLGVILVFLAERASVAKLLLALVIAAPIAIGILQLEATRSLVLSLNPRTYELLYNREKTLRSDPSYLVRLAMVEKGLEIHKRYPYTGIGLNNFSNYSVRIPGDFKGANLIIRKSGLNETSAHNSYVALLAEGGLFLLVSFISLLVFIIANFFVRSSKLSPSSRPFFIGLILMSIHLYFIMAIVNVFAWFLIGTCCAIISRTSHR